MSPVITETVHPVSASAVISVPVAFSSDSPSIPLQPTKFHAAVRPAILSRKTCNDVGVVKTNRVLSELATYSVEEKQSFPPQIERKAVSFTETLPIHPHALVASPNSFGIASMLTDMANSRPSTTSSTAATDPKMVMESSLSVKISTEPNDAMEVVNKENRAEIASVGNNLV